MRFSISRTVLAIILTFLTGVAGAAGTDEDCNNGYPTSAIADYVLGCMAANGNNFESLHQCSCSIDFVKSKITYENYERAQTVMRAQLDQGHRGLFYREASWAKKSVEQLEKAQAESTLRCF